MKIEILKEVNIYSDNPRKLNNLTIGVIDLEDNFANELIGLGYAILPKEKSNDEALKLQEKAIEKAPENKMFDKKLNKKTNK